MDHCEEKAAISVREHGSEPSSQVEGQENQSLSCTSSSSVNHCSTQIKANSDFKWLFFAFVILSAYTVVEFSLGLAINSLLLQTDAMHLIIDDLALLLATVASGVSRAKNELQNSRTEIFSAIINAILLIIFAGIAIVKAIFRCIQPEKSAGYTVLLIAISGVTINVIATMFLMRAQKESINVQAALQHVLSDLYGFIVTCLTGVIILSTHWGYADRIGSVIVAAVMVYSGVKLLLKAVEKLRAK